MATDHKPTDHKPAAQEPAEPVKVAVTAYFNDLALAPKAEEIFLKHEGRLSGSSSAAGGERSVTYEVPDKQATALKEELKKASFKLEPA